MSTSNNRYPIPYAGILLVVAVAWLFGAVAETGLSPCFGQSQSEDKKQKAPSARAGKIFSRAKTLAKNVIDVSKGAKGVGAPITDREAWEALAKASTFRNAVSNAEQYRYEAIPLPDEDDYMRYYKTVARTYAERNRDYERKFTARRLRLTQLVLAECMENKGRFLENIESTIHVLCRNEPCWTYPERDTDGARFKQESRSIDYETAQTAWDLATAHYWLGKKLSPDVRDLIHDTVTQRVLSVFEEAILTDNYSLISWANSSTLDNARCHAAVVGAALALIDSAERRAQYIAAAELNVEKFLQIFSRDGYFPDGIHSWNEGYGSFILMAEMMFQATGGRIDMFKRPNIKETALYGPRMEITPGVYEVPGNRWRNYRPQLFPTAFISKRFQMGLTGIENRAPFFGIRPGRHLYMIGIYCFPNSASEEMGQPGKTLVPPIETLRSEFPLSGVMILRTGKKGSNRLGVQIKGGNNDERGNHSDVGSYTVAIGGGKPLTDIGSRYNRRGVKIQNLMDSNFFNSFGHPVPKIDDKLQKNGKETIAPLLLREYTDEKDTLKFDLTFVYDWPQPKDLREITRTFVYERNDPETPSSSQATLTVIDRFRNMKPMPYENCLITLGPFKKLTEEDEATSFELVVGEGAQAIHVTITNEVTELDEETNKFIKRPKTLYFEAGELQEPMPTQSTYPLRLGFGFETPVDDMVMTIKIRPASNTERNLARYDAGKPTKFYTSVIDHPPSDESSGAAGGDGAIARYVDLIRKNPVLLQQFKNADDEQIEELKKQFPSQKRTIPQLRELPDLTDEQLDAVIRQLRES